VHANLTNTSIDNPLTKEALKVIAKINIQKIEEKLKDKKIKVNISDDILTKIAEETYNPQFGARPAIRMIQDKIENNIANQIIDGSLKDGDTLNL
jgi:ATP-dependent Clp protease ATP-binding subunit ClpB